MMLPVVEVFDKPDGNMFELQQLKIEFYEEDRSINNRRVCALALRRRLARKTIPFEETALFLPIARCWFGCCPVAQFSYLYKLQ